MEASPGNQTGSAGLLHVTPHHPSRVTTPDRRKVLGKPQGRSGMG